MVTVDEFRKTYGIKAMTYPLLEQAPKDHHSEEFLQFLRDNNEVLWEDSDWLTIKNVKYGWPTCFAKHSTPRLVSLLNRYRDKEWRVKPVEKRTVERFHIHIIT